MQDPRNLLIYEAVLKNKNVSIEEIIRKDAMMPYFDVFSPR
jgi:hypothetical protein